MIKQGSEFQLDLTAHRRAPSIAREALLEFGERLDLDELELDSLRLLASELVTNAVRHPRADRDAWVGLSVWVLADRIRIEVCDTGPGFEPPDRPMPREDDEGGYGLYLVNELAVRWGVEHDGCSVVWCELDREGVEVRELVPAA
jgi:anti-sigma regulatory factor (Ser/Thr protein kinase)